MPDLPYIGPDPDPEHPTAAFWQLIELARTDTKAAQARVAQMDRVALVGFYWAFHDAAELLREQPFEDATALPGEDGVAMTERVRGEVTRAAATHLEGRFGHWSGFTQWAPQTADRILSYLITGN